MSFAIRVDGLGKRYRLGATHARSVRELVNRTWRRLRRRVELLPHEQALLRQMRGRDIAADGTFWALKEVSFEVKAGDVVGIIGRNGSGKSTLLKVLSRVTAPTTGRVELHGRVASLLEVGTGFHPELSGRENVFLNGAILGMTRAEIRRKFDEIVAFAEIEQFIDTPVKRYSSGMYIRLAFAVAAHLEPEILVVDEVLAVGDAAFQQKCLGKMGDVARVGRTVLFVSHNMTAISALCSKGIVLYDGKIAASGETAEVIARYRSDALVSEGGSFDLTSHPARPVRYRPILRQVMLANASGLVTSRFTPDDSLVATIAVAYPGLLREPRIALAIEDAEGRRIFSVATFFQQSGIGAIEGSAGIKCTIPRLNLGSGRYLLSVSIGTKYEGLLDVIECFAQIEVEWANNYANGEPYNRTYGPVLQESRWERVPVE